MKYKIQNGPLAKLKSDCIAIGIHLEGQLSEEAQALDTAQLDQIKRTLKAGDFSGKMGEILLLRQSESTQRILLLGFGKANAQKPKEFRKLIRDAVNATKNLNVTDLCFALGSFQLGQTNDAWKIKRAITLAEEANYQFSEFKSVKPAKSKLHTISFWLPEKKVSPQVKSALAQGQATANGMTFARNIANRPGNICTPTHLAKQAKELSKEYSTIKTKILEEKEMEKLGMGALLSVSHGSKEPAKLIIMEYWGGKAKQAPHILVGKGITFDSGGISLKPALAMEDMKFDMCGAASVLGSMHAIAELKLPLNVIGVIASSENLPSGTATKPGDIVTSMSGQTIEIINTDAEGRLVLSDALTYVKRYKPASVIDIATLTGAMIMALGNYAAGVMTNTQSVADALLAASRDSDDPIWQMPLADEYQEYFESTYADMANTNTVGKGAGSITAACFLSRFTGDYPWAHLDIAGVAYQGGNGKGATGRPIPLLVQYLVDKAG